MPGRPLILEEHPDKIEEFLALVSEGVTTKAAAGSVGISRATIQSWRAQGNAIRDSGKKRLTKRERSYLDFLDSIVEAEDKAEAKFTLYVTRAAAGGDLRAAMYWLSRRRPKDWTEQQRHELVGDGDDPIRIELVWGNGNGAQNGNHIDS